MPEIQHYPERVFFDNVIAKAVAPTALESVSHQYDVRQNGRSRRVDFAIIGQRKKIALELDGFTYHAEGQVTQSEFSDHLERQNELVQDGWTVLRFSWQDVVERPSYCIDQIRRSLVGDESLHPILASRKLAPHLVQEEALDSIENARASGRNKGLVVLPTGLGKTYLAAFDARKFPGRILFIVHNNEILQQARDSLMAVMPERSVGLFNGFEKIADADVVCGNVHSLGSSNLRTYFQSGSFDYVIIDEFHHAAAPSYQAILTFFKPKFTLGLTATPVRTDQQDVYRLLDDNLIYQLDVGQAIARGFLSPFRYVAYRDNVDYSNIRHNGFRYDVQDLNKALIIERRDEAILGRYVQDGTRKAIGFCVSIEHSVRIANYFRDHGVQAEAVHSNLRSSDRAERIAKFRRNELQVLFVRDIFNEGVDFPDIEAVMFLRPTESRLVFQQQLGRGLRLCAGKSEVAVLDFIGNYRGADRVHSYFRDFGGEVEFADTGQKPILFFDNGCSVEFTAEAIEAINTVGIRVERDIDIVQAIFDWAGRKERLPTFCDVAAMPNLQISDIYRTYETWDGLIERLQRFAEYWEISEMLLPGTLGKLTMLEACEVIDLDRGLFQTAVQESMELSRTLFEALCLIVSGPQHTDKTNTKAKQVIEAVGVAAKSGVALQEHLLSISFVLSFQHDFSRLNVPPKVDGNAVQNLELATSFRDTSRVGCAIKELLPSLEVLFGEEIDYYSDSYFYRKVLMLYGPLAELIRDLRDIYENY